MRPTTEPGLACHSRAGPSMPTQLLVQPCHCSLHVVYHCCVNICAPWRPAHAAARTLRHGMARQPTCPNALLTVACTLELAHIAVGVNCSQEHRLELVHASIGEQQGRVIQRHLHVTATAAAEAWHICVHCQHVDWHVLTVPFAHAVCETPTAVCLLTVISS
jgi:hypothetical protein